MANSISQVVQERLERAPNIWVSTVRPDGRPHLVPVWFVWVEGRIYICIEPESRKGRNLDANPNITVALEDAAHPVICEGEGRFLPKPWPEPVIVAFRDKYDWDISDGGRYSGLVEIAPRKWLTW